MGKIINDIYVDWIDKVKILQKAVIKNKSGLILALKRTNDPNRPRPNCWDFPGGSLEQEDIEKWKKQSGRGDNDDILINSLRREIKEETNLEAVNIRIIHAASGFNEEKKLFTMAIGYACDAINENDLELSLEHAASKWIAKSDFLNLEIGNDGGLIRSILERSN
jgi:8-oxo-dGTP pyrophosphatase MutT (NUDIX family)